MGNLKNNIHLVLHFKLRGGGPQVLASDGPWALSSGIYPPPPPHPPLVKYRLMFAIESKIVSTYSIYSTYSLRHTSNTCDIPMNYIMQLARHIAQPEYNIIANIKLYNGLT